MDSDGNDVVTGLRATEPDGAVDQQPTLQLSDEPMPALHKVRCAMRVPPRAAVRPGVPAHAEPVRAACRRCGVATLFWCASWWRRMASTWTAWCGDARACRGALSWGELTRAARCRTQDQYHRTALHIAAQQNLLALVKALLDMGANVNAQDSVRVGGERRCGRGAVAALAAHSPPQHLRLPIHDSEAGSEVQELLLQHVRDRAMACLPALLRVTSRPRARRCQGADLRARDCFGRQAESRTPESSRGTPHLSHNCSASSLFRRRHLLRSNSMTAAEVHRVLRTFGSARRHSCPHVAMVALELELELEAETVEEVEVEDGVPAGGV